MPPRKLGGKLKTVREMKGLSLAAVAGPAGMSATYLQKLERDEVDSPSPHRLHSLAAVLELEYADLMELAGYVMPRGDTAGPSASNLLAQALSAENLTEDEIAELAEFIAFKRRNRN
ncbi:MAG: transcriptional regulator, family [Conexibacter sp.]|nr:transcriptional regulator, family [Conexibacter sp.]